ncbi:MAG TPA: response regulator [Gemmatimonadaceae bacterium]|jgi:DNA-binding NtrC family response regulator|nr:response regulator [Gemmatimonadaceae bacterium]
MPSELSHATERLPADLSGAAERALVLVVEDDAFTRGAVRDQLARGGYDVVESSSGREALELLRQGMTPRFLVADLRMADGSGGWLISHVGYEFPRLLAGTIVISGDAASAAAAHVRARWRCPVLAKPFDGTQLIDAIAELARLASGAAEDDSSRD